LAFSGKILDFCILYLAPTIHPVDRVDAVRDEGGIVCRVNDNLGCLKVVGTTPLAATGLGLFTFGLSHDSLKFLKLDEERGFYMIFNDEKQKSSNRKVLCVKPVSRSIGMCMII
jgi:hypothetical protein